MGLPARIPGDIRSRLAAIVTIFRQQGAKNVTWLWTVNINDTRMTSPTRLPGGLAARM